MSLNRVDIKPYPLFVLSGWLLMKNPFLLDRHNSDKRATYYVKGDREAEAN
ncbi:MAG: hypothetical protein RMX96_08545 [Nostoc sp. ChiSLP02]|nr:hypothetical protein [Nostoc sp. ChiSLP02]